jgi:ribosomal protein S18 acetylase RimI-like enzyme
MGIQVIEMSSNQLTIIDLDQEAMRHLAHELALMVRTWPLVDWTEENFLVTLPLKWQCSFAIRLLAEIKGFCVASQKPESTYYIHLIFVNSEERCYGLGTMMLNEAIERAVRLNMCEISLRCPRNNNDALQFYLRYGFTCQGKVIDEVSGAVGDYLMKYFLLS